MEQRLSSSQQRILVAFGEALLPPEVGVAREVTSADLATRIEVFLKRVGGLSLFGFGLLLWTFDLSVPLVWGRFTRFVSLGREDRVRYVRAWDESRLYLRRSALLAMKTVVTMVYCAIPEVQREIGFAPGNIVAGALPEDGVTRDDPRVARAGLEVPA